MRPLSSSELLDGWERGLNEPASTRLMCVLAAASAAGSPDALAELSIGERDRRLLVLREWTFGPRLFSVSTCPECRERLEWSVDASELFGRGEADVSGELSIESAGYSVRFRLPNTRDLAAASESGDVTAARQILLERCLIESSHEGRPTTAAEFPEPVVHAIAERMADSDRGADIDVHLTCPACGHRWAVLFDIESFFWDELSAWAQRILIDVHVLASAYGWREADILQLGQWRRQFYLSQVGV
jgi:hypothetical protein